MPTREDTEGTDVKVPGLSAFDVTKPNIARVYDYWLGGKDNFQADRAEAERMLEVYPLLRERARENRLFLVRAVDWLARQGVGQFLDVGSGLPTGRNTHEVAQDVDPACRVVYVDNDPVVITHGRALLSGDGVAVAEGDLGDPAAILAHPDVLRLIKLDEPIVLILAMVLHFFDAETAGEITAAFVRSIAPGSYVVISVGSGDEQTGGQVAREYRAGTLYNHSRAQIAGFFDGLELIGPGLVDAKAWDPGRFAAPPGHYGGRIMAGIGRKP